jgi:hypothetical protein
MFLRTLLQELQNIQGPLSLSEAFPASCWAILRQALHLTWTAIIEIQRARNKHTNPHKAGTRLKWAILGKKATENLLQSLQNAELELMLAMNLIQWYILHSGRGILGI